MLGIFDKISGALGGLVEGIFGGIDSISTTEEEKMAAKAVILKAEAEFRLKMAGLATELAAIQAGVITAEINSKHTLAAIWRPILMLSFGFVIIYAVVAPSLGAAPVDLSGIPERFWTLLTVGIGGYVGGRTLEKVTPAIVEGLGLRKSKGDE